MQRLFICGQAVENPFAVRYASLDNNHKKGGGNPTLLVMVVTRDLAVRREESVSLFFLSSRRDNGVFGVPSRSDVSRESAFELSDRLLFVWTSNFIPKVISITRTSCLTSPWPEGLLAPHQLCKERDGKRHFGHGRFFKRKIVYVTVVKPSA
ncbi:hypothetical protein CEXT_98471 [Caerostris extrusa]|uniref:Uncharacterized protein n=1 Tax=Caerostris extrusa TaxID=172846 RepID=A0AAV4S310_CAEEX|nr:hypothetical protein CEXT_98471 [Caerostris extrusa]